LKLRAAAVWRALAALLALTLAWVVISPLVLPRSHRVAFERLSTGFQASRTELQESPAPQAEWRGPATTRLLLIGDAGLAESDSAVIAELVARAARPGLTRVVYLGDNVYPAGLPPEQAPGRVVAEQRLRAQVAPFAGTNVELVFLPGNHDATGENPVATLRRQVEWLRTFAAAQGTRLEYVPEAGKPGPACFRHGQLELIALDTQWWLGPDYSAEQERAALAALERCLARAGAADTAGAIVLGHHPLVSAGLHAGFAGLKEHLFPFTRAEEPSFVPLPVLGSAFAVYRKLYPSVQDFGHPRYDAFVARLTASFTRNPPFVYAAGHEHSLQVLAPGRGVAYALVSGAGSRHTSVSHTDSTLFAQEALGFMELEVDAEGGVLLSVHRLIDGRTHSWRRRLR
jgi:hypothetical protein